METLDPNLLNHLCAEAEQPNAGAIAHIHSCNKMNKPFVSCYSIYKERINIATIKMGH